MPKPPQTVVHVDGEDPIANSASNEGGLVDDYSVSQTTLEQVFVRFASTQNEETQHAPGMTDGGFDQQQQQQPAAFPPQSPPQTAPAPAPASAEPWQLNRPRRAQDWRSPMSTPRAGKRRVRLGTHVREVA